MTEPEDRTIRAETVVAEVDAGWGAPCARCGAALIGHDVVVSMLMGLRAAPRCAACLAASVGDGLGAFLTRARANVARLDCYGAGWRHSDARLAASGAPWPEDRLPAALRLDRAVEPAAGADGHGGPAAAAAPEPELAACASFDAGDMGCGDLVLELRGRLLALAPGELLRVRATDPGAPGDLPAWCRVTGHPLVHAAHPDYWIRRRDA